MNAAPTVDVVRTVSVDGLRRLIEAFGAEGATVFGPVERDGAIVVRPIESVDELPVGVGTDHGPGRGRLTHGSDSSRFGWAVGPQAWKPLLHPADVTTMELTQAERTAPVTVRSIEVPEPTQPRAVLFGVRPCDLAAIETLDRVLLQTPRTPEPVYLARRDVLIVVVDCNTPAATCFCSSMGTGPHADRDDRDDHIDRDAGYDLRLTELTPDDGDRPTDPSYVVRTGSAAGRQVIERLDRDGWRTAATSTTSASDHDRVAAAKAAAEATMTRSIDAAELAASLRAVGASDAGFRVWSDVAERCVACGNCTAVCPTCFCTSIDDVGDLTGELVERRRRWASCFELEYSRVGSAPIRASGASRYRQWYTHKFVTWFDQFGTSGCVGCGRCIAWCPMGIDVTAEGRRLVDLRADTSERAAP